MISLKSFYRNGCRPSLKICHQQISRNFFHDRSNFSTELETTTSSNLQHQDYSGAVQSVTNPTRPKLRVKHVLEGKKYANFTISQDATVDQAISHLTINNVSSLLAVDSSGDVTGIFTARDILRCMHTYGSGRTNGKEKSLQLKIKDIMVTKDKMLICSPNDTALQVRQMMAQSKIRHVPVLENGEILSILTIKDLADSSFSSMDYGGKKGFIRNITNRKGMPEGTRIRKQMDLAAQQALSVPLEVDAGHYALPHPYKKLHAVGASRRDYGAVDLCNDLSLCEDAHFAMKVEGPPSISGWSSGQQLYMGVADGVGSWRQYGIDPRLFSHSLIRNAQKTIELDAMHRESLRTYPADPESHGEPTQGGLGIGGLLMNSDPILPLDVMVDAWNMTVTEGIAGSSTLCVAMLDRKNNQLAYSNVGDCGLVIIRHIDSETAGYMRERHLPRHLRKNDLRIAYLAQQQLRSFNFPYQLGSLGDAFTAQSSVQHSNTQFETPKDADTASIPVMPGDIILLATDGLFDNLDLNEIVDFVSEWEYKWFSTDGKDLRSPDPQGQEAINDLAKGLVNRAREMSLDTQRDSPFAVLAKENDIMWGGGMPDDTSVVVARVYKPTAL